MAQSKAEFSKIPEIDFKVAAGGITILCSRLYTPRFVQFDTLGRCECCGSDSIEIDFAITIEGVTIYCKRMRQPKFVPFDYKYKSFPQNCLFRVKTKGKVFNIMHGKEQQLPKEFFEQEQTPTEEPKTNEIQKPEDV